MSQTGTRLWRALISTADQNGHFMNGHLVDRLISGDAPALAAEILTNRNGMLAGRSAKEESGALPDELNQTIRGYQESRVILTLLRG